MATIPKFVRPVEFQTESQKLYYNIIGDKESQIVLCHGMAGTGKTFISIYLALEEVMEKSKREYNKLYIVRSVVSTRDVGFLPGDKTEKIEVYEDPYISICAELFKYKDAYEKLKKRN